MRHGDGRLAVQNPVIQVCASFGEGVLTDSERAEGEKELAEGDGAEDGVPGIASSGDHVALGEFMFFDLELADEAARTPRVRIFLAARILWIPWAQGEQDGNRAARRSTR